MTRTIKHLSVKKELIDDYDIDRISVFGDNLLSLELKYSIVLVSQKNINLTTMNLCKYILYKNIGIYNSHNSSSNYLLNRI